MSETTLIGQPAAESTPGTARPVLCFERTPAGEHQLKSPALVLSPEATRLLMLFEEPQTIDDLRRIIDETWLPAALIELERRRLLRRVDPARWASRIEAADHASHPPGKLTQDAPDAPMCHADAADGQTPAQSAAQVPSLPSDSTTARDLSALDTTQAAAARLARQRAQARILFLQQIGRLSTLMIERIEACQSEAELQRLTPAFIDLLAAPPATPARPQPIN